MIITITVANIQIDSCNVNIPILIYLKICRLEVKCVYMVLPKVTACMCVYGLT
jgi:lipid A disaccharide synthetase